MKKLLFLSLLCFCFVSFSQESDPYQASKYYTTDCGNLVDELSKKAEKKLKDGNLIRAIEIYEKAISLQPNNQKVICRLEELYLEKEQLINEQK